MTGPDSGREHWVARQYHPAWTGERVSTARLLELVGGGDRV